MTFVSFHSQVQPILFQPVGTVAQSSNNAPNKTTNLTTDPLELGATPLKIAGMKGVRGGGVAVGIPTLPTVPEGNELDSAGIG